MAYVFVSHANEDREWVRQHVVGPLRAAGHTPFFSDESLKVGANFLREITKELVKSEKLLVVVSSRSANSEWVPTEVEIWFRKHGGNNPIPVLMESIEACDVHPRLVYCQSIDLSNPTLREQHIRRLLNELTGTAGRTTTYPPAIAGQNEPPGTATTSPQTSESSGVGDRPTAEFVQLEPAEEDDSSAGIERTSDVPVGNPQPPRPPRQDQSGLAPPKEAWTVLVLDALSGRPVPNIGVRLRPEASGSFARHFMSRLVTQSGTTNLSGKVVFTPPSAGTTVEVSLEDATQYRQMPPRPGFVKPPGVNKVVFVARKY